MGFRFRRSLKLAPGVRLNFGKGGVTSFSVGRRGASLNVGQRGVTRTLAIPGTGLSHTQRLSLSTHQAPATAVVVAPPIEAPDPRRFGIVPKEIEASAGRSKWMYMTTGAVACAAATAFASSALKPSPVDAVLLLAGGVTFLIGVALPSRKQLLRREFRRCDDLARAELQRRVAAFDSRIQSLRNGDNDAEQLRALLRYQTELGLSDDEAGPKRMEIARAFLAFHEHVAAVTASGVLPTVAGHEHITEKDTCYFAEEAVWDKPGVSDPRGTLYLTNARLLFMSRDGLATVPWGKVVSVVREGNELHVQRKDRQTPYRFRMSERQALIAAWTVNRLQQTKMLNE